MKRFSLRSLLVLTAIIAVLLAIPFRRAKEQQRARQWVASQKGHISFAYEYDPTTDQFNRNAKPAVPEWLIDRFGIDLFVSVDTVILDNTYLEDLTAISGLRDLRSLAIIIEIHDDLDFEPLAELPKLRHLHLDYTGITAERLAKLRKLIPHVRVDAMNHSNPE